MTEHLEIEQKFDVDTGFARPSFGGLTAVSASAPVLYHLSATYYDTADQRLGGRQNTPPRPACAAPRAAPTSAGTGGCPDATVTARAPGARSTRRSARATSRCRTSWPGGW